MKRLFLVESPTKIKTLKKILEKQVDQFTFLATLGHIKDLPTNNLGIDLDSFEPKLIFLPSNQNGSDTSARHILDAGHIAKEINEKLRDVGFEAKAVNVSTADRYTGIANVQDTADLTFYVGDKRFTISGVETNISLDRLVEKINRAAGTAGADLNASISDGRLVSYHCSRCSTNWFQSRRYKFKSTYPRGSANYQYHKWQCYKGWDLTCI